MPSKRAETSLHAPDPAKNYQHFPQKTLRKGLRWWRAHDSTYNPWWFSNTPGRFNLTAPNGTLNLGSSAQVALRELLGPTGVASDVLSSAFLAGKVVSCLEIPEVTIADFHHPAAATFGILASDAAGPTTPNYTVPRAWAETLHKAGHQGILARSRCGAGTNPQCLFIFGPAGVHPLGEIVETVTAEAVVAQMPGYSTDSRIAAGEAIMDE